MDIQAGILGQLAGHSVAWFLDGRSLADITSMPSLMMAGVALASEVAVLTLAPSNKHSVYQCGCSQRRWSSHCGSQRVRMS
jgi:hypothetical protein